MLYKTLYNTIIYFFSGRQLLYCWEGLNTTSKDKNKTVSNTNQWLLQKWKKKHLRHSILWRGESKYCSCVWSKYVMQPGKLVWGFFCSTIFFFLNLVLNQILGNSSSCIKASVLIQGEIVYSWDFYIFLVEKYIFLCYYLKAGFEAYNFPNDFWLKLN